jgi:outer membrane protein assembly factor BamA
MQLKTAYFNDEYASLSNNVRWSLFRTKKSFRDNPPVNEGNVRSVLLTFDLHKLNSYKQEGWSISLSSEFAGKAFKGDYDFNRYVLDLRRYQPLSRYDRVNLQLRLATSEGDLPEQRTFEIGGISTMPAFSYKQFAGNRMILGNIEYLVDGSMFSGDTDFPLSIIDAVNLILFADAGYVTEVPGSRSFDKGFDKFKFIAVKSDLGFGFGSRDGKYRLGFAWRTDIKAPPTVFIRLSRPF